MRPLSLGRRRRSRPLQPSASCAPRPPTSALCAVGLRAATHSSLGSYVASLRPLRFSAASLAPAPRRGGLPVPVPLRQGGSRRRSLLSSRSLSGVGGRHRVAASPLTRWTRVRGVARPMKPALGRIERPRSAARIKIVPSSQLARK